MTSTDSTLSRRIPGLGTIEVKDHSGPQPTVWLLLKITLDESARGMTHALAKQIIADAIDVSKRGHGCTDVLTQKLIAIGDGDNIEYVSKWVAVDNLIRIELDVLEPETAEFHHYADYCAWIERCFERFSVLLSGNTAQYYSSSDNGSVVTTTPQPR